MLTQHHQTLQHYLISCFKAGIRHLPTSGTSYFAACFLTSPGTSGICFLPQSTELETKAWKKKPFWAEKKNPLLWPDTGSQRGEVQSTQAIGHPEMPSKNEFGLVPVAQVLDSCLKVLGSFMKSTLNRHVCEIETLSYYLPEFERHSKAEKGFHHLTLKQVYHRNH